MMLPNYDVSIIGTDGNEHGMMLLTDSNGYKLYERYDDPALAQQYFTGIPDYAFLPPQKEIHVGQDDWRSGFGQEIFDDDETRKYFTSYNIDARFKGMIICGPSTATSATNQDATAGFIDFNDTLYRASGVYLYKYSSDTWTLVETFTADITDLEVFGDNLFIALGDSTKFQYMNTSEAFTESGEADGYATFFTNDGSTMWKVVLPNEAKSASDPTSTWSTATSVNSTYYNITDILTEDGTIYIMKEDQPFYLDTSGNVKRLAPELRASTNSTSGKNSLAWQGKLYIPCGTQSLYEYDSGTITDVSPAKYVTNDSDFTGKIVALAGDSQWLFAIVSNDVKSEVLAGRWETVAGINDWVWHPISEVTLEVGSAYASAVGNNRLWLGNKNDSTSVMYIDLPEDYGDVTQTGTQVFSSGGHIITPYQHANFKSDEKSWYKITLTTSNLSDDNYFDVDYQLYGDSEWVSAGRFNTSPLQTAYLLANTPHSEMIRFKFTATSTQPTWWELGNNELGVDTILGPIGATPVIINYDVRGAWKPDKRKIIACSVQCGDNVTTKDGSQAYENESSIRLAIEDATDSKYPLKFCDIDGTEKYIEVLSAKKTNVTIPNEGNPEYAYELQIAEVEMED